MEINQMALAYSLKMFVEKETGVPTVIKFDGIVLPKEKPFGLVGLATNTNYKITKLRESVQTVFRFQFGIFTNTGYELSELQNELRSLFLFKEIPLYTSEGVLTDKVFMFSDNITEAKMNASDRSDETSNHRMYFDLEKAHVFTKRRNS